MPGWLRVLNEFGYAQALALSVDGVPLNGDRKDALGVLFCE